jgi:hypothetical protein
VSPSIPAYTTRPSAQASADGKIRFCDSSQTTAPVRRSKAATVVTSSPIPNWLRIA